MTPGGTPLRLNITIHPPVRLRARRVIAGVRPRRFSAKTYRQYKRRLEGTQNGDVALSNDRG